MDSARVRRPIQKPSIATRRRLEGHRVRSPVGEIKESADTRRGIVPEFGAWQSRKPIVQFFVHGDGEFRAALCQFVGDVLGLFRSCLVVQPQRAGLDTNMPDMARRSKWSHPASQPSRDAAPGLDVRSQHVIAVAQLQQQYRFRRIGIGSVGINQLP